MGTPKQVPLILGNHYLKATHTTEPGSGCWTGYAVVGTCKGPELSRALLGRGERAAPRLGLEMAQDGKLIVKLFHTDMSCSLNSLKGLYRGLVVIQGDTGSLDHGSHSSDLVCYCWLFADWLMRCWVRANQVPLCHPASAAAAGGQRGCAAASRPATCGNHLEATGPAAQWFWGGK